MSDEAGKSRVCSCAQLGGCPEQGADPIPWDVAQGIRHQVAALTEAALNASLKASLGLGHGCCGSRSPQRHVEPRMLRTYHQARTRVRLPYLRDPGQVTKIVAGASTGSAGRGAAWSGPPRTSR
jgi:hypothetical protein